MLHVERVLRATHRRNQAAMAGLTVVALVQRAARRDGVDLPDDDVTRVARAAEQVARAIVGGPPAARDANLTEVPVHIFEWAVIAVEATRARLRRGE